MGPNLNSNNDLYAYTFLYNFGVQEIPFDTLENVENKLSVHGK